MSNPFIAIKNLSIGYNSTKIISGIDANLFGGNVTALIGANGVGKSTLLKTISGEIKALTGEIFIYDKPLQSYSKKSLAKQVALVSTDSILAGGLTVRELVELGRQPFTGIFGKLSEEDHNIVTQAMEMTGIIHKQSSYLANLSDGERQKAMIARALAQQTRIIILDEPFSFLDAASKIDIYSMLSDIAKENDKAILISSHDIPQTLRIADKLWIITQNKRLNATTPDEAARSGILNEVFQNTNIRFDSAINDYISVKNRL